MYGIESQGQESQCRIQNTQVQDKLFECAYTGLKSTSKNLVDDINVVGRESVLLLDGAAIGAIEKAAEDPVGTINSGSTNYLVGILLGAALAPEIPVLTAAAAVGGSVCFGESLCALVNPSDPMDQYRKAAFLKAIDETAKSADPVRFSKSMAAAEEYLGPPTLSLGLGLGTGALSKALTVECGKLAGAQLAGAQLAGAQLAGAQLAGAQLAGAQIAGTQLAGDKFLGSMPIKKLVNIFGTNFIPSGCLSPAGPNRLHSVSPAESFHDPMVMRDASGLLNPSVRHNLVAPDGGANFGDHLFLRKSLHGKVTVIQGDRWLGNHSESLPPKLFSGNHDNSLLPDNHLHTETLSNSTAQKHAGKNLPERNGPSDNDNHPSVYFKERRSSYHRDS